MTGDSETGPVPVVGKTKGEQKQNRLVQVFEEDETQAEADSQQSSIENE